MVSYSQFGTSVNPMRSSGSMPNPMTISWVAIAPWLTCSPIGFRSTS